MQPNHPSQPPNRLGQQHYQTEHYQRVGPDERHVHVAAFQSSEGVEAFMNRAAAQSREYDLEPLPGEFGPWGREAGMLPLDHLTFIPTPS